MIYRSLGLITPINLSFLKLIKVEFYFRNALTGMDYSTFLNFVLIASNRLLCGLLRS